MPALARLGLIELAFGATLGWGVAATLFAPEALKRVGVKSPRRVLQCHLDYIIMGVLVTAVAHAAPDVPTWTKVALGFGTVANPAFFMVLAFGESLARQAWFKPLMLASFTATSGSLIAIAILA